MEFWLGSWGCLLGEEEFLLGLRGLEAWAPLHREREAESMTGMTESQGSRSGAIFAMLGACAAIICLVFDVSLIVMRHPTGGRLSWDIAYLPIYGLGARFFVTRYRRFSAHSSTAKTLN
jgi:hypothetical protein